MNILYIWDADYPWDVRVEKICSALVERGNTVHIAARNLKKLAEYDIDNDLHIHRIKPYTNSRTNYFLSFPVFFSPIWKRFLDKIIAAENIDLIIVRDLPMAIAGIWAGKRNNIPVLFDMAEDYVSLVGAMWKSKKFKGFNLIVRNPYLAKIVERYSFKRADHIFVVAEEAADVVLRGGGEKDKVTVVGNTPSLSVFKQQEKIVNDTLDLIEKKYSAIYVGGIQLGRGLQIVIEALPEIVRKIPDFLFVVVGDGYAVKQLKEQAKRLGVEKYVLWVGWVEHQLIYNYVSLCKVGLIPHVVNDHKNTTIPNKLYDYMGLGLPVVASAAAPLKRILEEERCGVVFKSESPEDFCRAINDVYERADEYGALGKQAVENKHNWSVDEERLAEVVSRYS
ncbi:glycosyltransferase family 4 protein [Oceanicoccus sp. KOV_DT_Chl]|uniref:glycosyltransferase family 4 protein n=1 Tax=Oceanicoccus sp. KOV_DT_Chl TaxID=1904639 RepID=UPI000C7A582B|nr:glycosyltransferase family 4 protein [Oceanicoccus sp. KOV_DT_Chl]